MPHNVWGKQGLSPGSKKRGIRLKLDVPATHQEKEGLRKKISIIARYHLISGQVTKRKREGIDRAGLAKNTWAAKKYYRSNNQRAWAKETLGGNPSDAWSVVLRRRRNSLG